MNSLFKRRAVAILTITAIGMQNVAVLSANVVGGASTINKDPFTYETNITTSSQITVETTTSSAIQVEDVGNLLKNGNFETVEVAIAPWENSIKPAEWDERLVGNNKMPSFESIQRDMNNKAVEIKILEDSSRAELRQEKVSVKPATKYTLSVEANVSITASNTSDRTGNFGIMVKQFDKDGNEIKISDNKPYFQEQSTNGWKDFSADLETTADTYFVQVIMMIGATNVINAGTIQVDNIALKEIKTDINVPVKGISLNKNYIEDEIGTIHQLDATIEPANATNKNVTWSSSDESIAVVNNEGKVTLVGKGNAQISVTTEEGEFSATCEIVANEVEVALKNGDFSELEDVVTANDQKLWPEGQKPKYWSASPWGSYTPPVMRVVNVEDRENVLEMKVQDGNTRITVLQRTSVVPNTNYKLSFDANIEGVAGNDFGIQIKQYDASGKELADLRKTICRTKETSGWKVLEDVVYTSSDTQAIEVVIMAGAAAHLIAGTIRVDNFVLSPIHVEVNDIALSQTDVYDEVGKEYQLDATIKPANASNKKIRWQSTDESVVQVDQTGKVTLVAPGQAEIIAISEASGLEAKCQVTVVEKVIINELTLPTQLELEMGSTVKLTPVIEPAGVPLQFVKWGSSDETVATVTGGRVVPVSTGKVTITVSSLDETVKAECQINVVEATKNYVPNGGMEELDDKQTHLPKGYSYWTPTGSVQAKLDTDAYRGDYSFKIVAEENARTSINTPTIPLQAGTYRISLWTKMENVNASQGVRFRYNIIKEDGGKITNYSSGKKVADDWEQISLIVQAPEGTQSIDVQSFFETGTGTVWIDEIKIEEWTLLEDVTLPQELTIDLNTGNVESSIIPTFTPAHASDKTLVWVSSNDKVAKVENGKVIGKRAGEAIITAMTPDGKIKATTRVVVTGQLPDHMIKPIQKIEFENAKEKIQEGITLKLSPVITPDDATYQDLIWHSSQPEVAEVVEGRITGKMVGTTVITATSEDGRVSASCEIEVVPEVKNEFDELRIKWKERQIGTQIDLNDKDIKAFIESKEASAKKEWEAMEKNEGRIYLWADTPDYAQSGHIKEAARKLRDMAVAATLEGSSLKGNKELIHDTVEATLWLYKNAYSTEHLTKYNWWDWEIGIPATFNDIFVLLHEYFTPEEIQEVMGFVQNTIMPDPLYSGNAQQDWREATGANLIDQVKVALIPAILLENEEKLRQATSYIGSTLRYVTSADGFYEDGSFIQHSSVAYTGTYGAVLLDGIVTLIEFLADTDYDISNDPQIRVIYEITRQAFIPLIHKGGVMDMVRGRAIARAGSDWMGNGRSIVNSIMKLGYIAPEPYASEFLGLCKGWIEEARAVYNYSPVGNPHAITLTNQLLNDESTQTLKMPNISKEFTMMNRTVHHADNFAVGISKSSKRVKTYELTNGENQKGWYTGDGMTYLYNNDLGQFDDMFWVTVDYYRLPGTTVDTRTRTWGDYQNGDGETTPNNTWSGGSSLDVYGASGMDLKAIGSDLTAKKSWFMFDDEVVAIGSGINSNADRMIETTVEQRKIEGSNTFTINGETKSSELGWAEQVQNVEWAHLEGTIAGSDIGYYFPNSVTLNAKRETRSGSFHEISLNNDHKIHTRNYLTMWLEHGKNPDNEVYAYSLLPGKSAEEVASYSQNPDFEIIAQTEEVHAVKETTLGMIGMNFWEPSIAGYVTAQNPCSIMIKEGVGTLSLGISDPTLAAKEITIVLDKSDYKVISKDDTVSVTDLGTQIEVKVNTDKSMGKTHTLELVSNKPVQITLDKQALSLRKGQSDTLRVSFIPDQSTPEELMWTSSDERVASVEVHGDGTATVRANKKGEAEIRVSTIDGRLNAICKVTVRNNDNGQSDDDWMQVEVPKTDEQKQKEFIETVNKLAQEEKTQLENIIINELPYTTLTGEKLPNWKLDKLPKEIVEMINKNPELLVEVGININDYMLTPSIEPIQEPKFSDMKETHWAQASVVKAAELGIVKGYPTGEFKPSENLTVEDTFTFLDRVLLINGVTDMKLTRQTVEQYVTDKTHWAFNHIASVGSKLTEGTLKEVMNNKEGYITRELLAQVIYEISGMPKVTQNNSAFKDIDNSKYQDALLYCVEKGLLQGINVEEIAPNKVLTRAELMTVLIRLNEELQ